MQANTVVPFPVPSGANDPSRPPNEWRMHGDWTSKNLPLSSPVAQKGIDRQLARVWGEHLTDPEYRLLHFILDQTAGWGKYGRNFTHHHLATGNGYTSGTGKGRSQTSKHLASLEKKGFVIIGRTNLARGMFIEPNLEWEPPLQQVANPPVRHRRRPSTHPDPADIEQTMRRAFDREYGRDRNAVWTPWTDDQRAKVANVLITWWPMSTADEIHRLFDWLVEHWHGLTEFYGMPAYPDVEFFCRHTRVLLLEFENGRRNTSSG